MTDKVPEKFGASAKSDATKKPRGGRRYAEQEEAVKASKAAKDAKDAEKYKRKEERKTKEAALEKIAKETAKATEEARKRNQQRELESKVGDQETPKNKKSDKIDCEINKLYVICPLDAPEVNKFIQDILENLPNIERRKTIWRNHSYTVLIMPALEAEKESMLELINKLAHDHAAVIKNAVPLEKIAQKVKHKTRGVRNDKATEVQMYNCINLTDVPVNVFTYEAADSF